MITYNVFGDAYLLEEYSGKVNEKEYFSLKQSQLQKTDYFSIKGIVMDFRKMKMRATRKMIKRFVQLILRNQEILANKSIAILTKTMEQLNFSYLLRESLEQHAIPVHIREFSSKQDAFHWLNTGAKQ
ncbi:MAG: hypothetical protein ACLFPE_11265 [Bacteroidales bacterium]